MLTPAEWWSNEYDMRGEKRIKRIIENQIPWDLLTFNQKMLFFDLWAFLAVIGNVVQIILTSTLLIG